MTWETARRSFCFFFFQAEDGIRDLTVTGVQTCALPIFAVENAREEDPGVADDRPTRLEQHRDAELAKRRQQDPRVLAVGRRRLVAVADAEAAADVDHADLDRPLAQGLDERGDARDGVGEDRESTRLN